MDLNDIIASTASAQAQMKFQERMSNTAHQREVADLKAAGLNPVLSAGGKGASTPEGASGDYSAVLGMLAQSMQNNAKAMNALGSTTVKAIEGLVQNGLSSGLALAKEQKDHDQEIDDKKFLQDNNSLRSWKPLGLPMGIWIDDVAIAAGYDSGDEMLRDWLETGMGNNKQVGKAFRSGLKDAVSSAKDLQKKPKKKYHVTVGKTGFWSY